MFFVPMFVPCNDRNIAHFLLQHHVHAQCCRFTCTCTAFVQMLLHVHASCMSVVACDLQPTSRVAQTSSAVLTARSAYPPRGSVIVTSTVRAEPTSTAAQLFRPRSAAAATMSSCAPTATVSTSKLACRCYAIDPLEFMRVFMYFLSICTSFLASTEVRNSSVMDQRGLVQVHVALVIT